jgi:hypothetical protein
VPLDAPAARRLLESVPVGYVDDGGLTTTVRVPRGELRFQADFVADVRTEFANGPVPLGAAAQALAGGRRDAGEIVRNLTYLVAAGALQPFARAAQLTPQEGERRRPVPLLARTLELIRQDRASRPVPSPVLGNGVTLDIGQAQALAEWFAAPEASRPAPAIAALVQALDRLGLLT